MQPASSAAALTAAQVRRVVPIRRTPRSLRSGLAVGPTVSCANIPGSGTSRLPCLRMVHLLPRSQILGPRTAISKAMEQILGWARLWFAAKREDEGEAPLRDRKSTRLNSSHQITSYAVFCLKQKNLRRLVAVDRRGVVERRTRRDWPGTRHLGRHRRVAVAEVAEDEVLPRRRCRGRRTRFCA